MDKETKKYYMYVLLCDDQTLYTGFTDDVSRRFQTHLSGKGAKYTRAHKPVKILYQQAFETKHDAMSAEYAFKKMTRAKKLQYINRNDNK